MNFFHGEKFEQISMVVVDAVPFIVGLTNHGRIFWKQAPDGAWTIMAIPEAENGNA